MRVYISTVWSTRMTTGLTACCKVLSQPMTLPWFDHADDRICVLDNGGAVTLSESLRNNCRSGLKN